jgi:hypothetical protein
MQYPVTPKSLVRRTKTAAQHVSFDTGPLALKYDIDQSPNALDPHSKQQLSGHLYQLWVNPRQKVQYFCRIFFEIAMVLGDKSGSSAEVVVFDS